MKEVYRELKIKRHIKGNICAMMTSTIIPFCTHSILFKNYATARWTNRIAVELDVENDRFTVVCSLCR